MDQETPLDARGAPPPPDAVPPTMPAEARTARSALAPEDYPAPGDEAAEGVPPGTAPEVQPALGTSETMAPATGVHTPDVGEGGAEFDTAATPLPGRTDYAR
jgi:hypothetical protein